MSPSSITHHNAKYIANITIIYNDIAGSYDIKSVLCVSDFVLF